MHLVNNYLEKPLNFANDMVSRTRSSIEDKCQAVFQSCKQFLDIHYVSIRYICNFAYNGSSFYIPLAFYYDSLTFYSGYSVIGILLGGIISGIIGAYYGSKKEQQLLEFKIRCEELGIANFVNGLDQKNLLKFELFFNELTPLAHNELLNILRHGNDQEIREYIQIFEGPRGSSELWNLLYENIRIRIENRLNLYENNARIAREQAIEVGNIRRGLESLSIQDIKGEINPLAGS